ncbi:hypothetical protein ACOMHN_008493 [Nucella lapillus]
MTSSHPNLSTSASCQFLPPRSRPFGHVNLSAHLIIDTEDYFHCAMQHPQKRYSLFTARTGDLQISKAVMDELARSSCDAERKFYACVFSVTLPEKTIPKVTFLHTPPCDSSLTQFILYGKDEPLYRACESVRDRWPEELKGDHNVLTFEMSISRHSPEVQFTFQAVPSDKHSLEVVYVSTVSGILLQELNQNIYPPEPHLLNGTVFSVRFFSDSEIGEFGFHLRFTFHNASAVPQQFQNGFWNCSVDHWFEFRQHFPCNLLFDCFAGEEESDCVYTTEKCGQGYITINDMYIKPSRDISWNEAARMCDGVGMQLACLNSALEWRNVVDMLQLHEYRLVFTGLKSSKLSLASMYNRFWQWQDGQIAYFLNMSSWKGIPNRQCSALYSMKRRLPPHLEDDPSTVFSGVFDANRLREKGKHKCFLQCPGGHYTRRFLASDVTSNCWARERGFSAAELKVSMTPLPPSMECSTTSSERVPFALVCDHRPDCLDNSDEDFCVYPPCELDQLQCQDKHCIPLKGMCDNTPHCPDGSDFWPCNQRSVGKVLSKIYVPPAAVYFQERLENFESLPDEQCPDTHYLCPGNGYCMPVYTLCNEVIDCPGYEDEEGCDSYACIGYYRCRGSKICLHPVYLGDGVYQCPQFDDELPETNCTENCTCYHTSLFCHDMFPADEFPQLRFLDGRDSGITPSDLVKNTMLVHLSLVRCGITSLPPMRHPNLLLMDVSHNLIRQIYSGHVSGLSNLRTLNLTSNPLSSHLIVDEGHSIFASLISLDLSFSHIKELHPDVLQHFSMVRSLNLSYIAVETIVGEGFQPLKQLRVLDLRACPATQFHTFQGLANLRSVYADSYKACCPAVLPEGFNTANCWAPQDLVSSCDDLLCVTLFKVVIIVFSVTTLTGNFVHIVYHLVFRSALENTVLGLLMRQLCVSSAFMGLALSIIAVADLRYQGSYVWHDTSWRSSVACQLVGVLATFSTEASMMFLFLITVERLMVMFNIKEGIWGSGQWYSCIVSALVWIVSALFSSLPLSPRLSDWRLNTGTSLCLPLPLTVDKPSDRYRLGLMVTFNLLVMLVTGIGQLLIYRTIRQTTSLSVVHTTTQTQHVLLPRRFFSVVMTDVFCWVFISLFALLDSNSIPLPANLNVILATCVLPANSALNPFMYFYNVIMERRRQEQEERLKKMIISRIKAAKLRETGIPCQTHSC